MRLWLRALLGLVVMAGVSVPARAATDLSEMQPSEIEALQKRLTDDGCYAGPIDGQASAATAQAVKVCPDQSPILRVETGMHTAPIWRIGVDAACRLMVTGSKDKSLRLWSLSDGRLLRTIRLPIGPGSDGEMRAVAISPDGLTVVAGGWDAEVTKGQGNGLYIVDLPSGAVRKTGNFEGFVNDIAMSADGSRIALALGKQGIRVVETTTGRELMADRYDGQSYGVTFAADGSIYATSYDGFLRSYGPDLKLTAKVQAPDGATSVWSRTRPVRRATRRRLRRRRRRLDPRPANLQADSRCRGWRSEVGQFGCCGLDPRWASVGHWRTTRLQIGGTRRTIVRRFDAAGRIIGDVPVSMNTVMDLQACGSSIAFGAQDPAFGLIGTNGLVRNLQGPLTADMRTRSVMP